ncbi:MAG: type II toxin-antitoxin system PemK/MazF family toxin [Phycisphaerae bacterium]|nr:type II toxin-antitoxin system PemK/MazF family toxin [Phycisphaerae bacterium]
MSSPRTNAQPQRGEVWLIRFDPATGAEITKTRPAVVVNPASVGRLPLRIVVPVTAWDRKYETVPWLVFLAVNSGNGLDKDSAADCFQVKSVSTSRFVKRLGSVGVNEIEEISAAIAICVGAD